MNPILIILVLTSVSFNAIAQLVLRKAMISMAPTPAGDLPALALALILNPYLWLGLLSFGASLGLWLVVLARLPVSIAYPLASLGYVVAAILGMVLLGEAMSPARAAGIAVICFGVFLVARTG